MDKQWKEHLVLSGAEQGHNVTVVFKLSTFNYIPVLDTTSCAQIHKGADQAGHKMEVDTQSHPHQIVSTNLVAFIKWFLDVSRLVLTI